jgi:dTDP-glucose 4,6-dehydratase
MSILVTGGAGFIGSNFIPYFLNKYSQYKIVNLDKLTYAGNLANLKEVERHPRYKFMQGDIADREQVECVFEQFDIRGVIHLAAESHVDNSIASPDIFVETNIRGTFTLLDVARGRWTIMPHICRPGYEHCRFHHISTDEVYGSLGETGLFTEDSRYAPNSPYSASKASGDMIARSYFHTYGLDVVITNCSNNYGPKQHEEKFIPTVIRKALSLEKIPIYGDGRNVRDWLYVLDHCRAIDMVYHFGETGETYNIGGRNERENLDVARLVCEVLDETAAEFRRRSNIASYKEMIDFVRDRPGHDRRYAMDPSKIETKLGWRPQEDFETGILKTVLWYLEERKT